MKHSLSVILLLITLIAVSSGCATPQPKITPIPTPVLGDVMAKIHWFGTSAILYNGSKVIYFDPIALAGNLPQADVILVTHAHSDHWSVPDLKKIIGPKTTLIIGPIVSKSYELDKSELGIPATFLADGQTANIGNVSVKAVPAFDTLGHVKGSGGEGFLVKIDGITLYHTGGTAAYDDMANYACDVAFVPVYSKDSAMAMAQIIPAKVIVFEHTSFYAAQAVATLAGQAIQGKTFVGLQDGPNSVPVQ